MKLNLCALVLAAATSWVSVSALAQTPTPNTPPQPTATELEPLRAYLRCERLADEREQARRKQLALNLLSVLFKPAETDKNPTQMPPVFLDVWPGIRAQLHPIGGMGFFGVLQYYAATDLQALRQALTQAGWEMKRSPSGSSTRRGMALVPVYKGTQSNGDFSRYMTLMEARVNEEEGEVDLDGLTLICAYGYRNPK